MAELKQTNTIVHPRFGCAIGAAYTVAAIPGGVPIANCGPGCADKQYFALSGISAYPCQSLNGTWSRSPSR